MSSKRNTQRTRKLKKTLREANVGCLLMLFLLIGLPFVALGGFFIYIGHQEMREQARLNDSAVDVAATILSSEVRRQTVRTGPGTGSTTSAYWPEIIFRYDHEGDSWTSRMVWPVGEGGTEVEAKAVQERYRQGITVSAFVDPKHPGAAFLEKRWSQDPYVSVTIGNFSVAFVIGLGILLTGWKEPRLATGIATLATLFMLVSVWSAIGHYLRCMPVQERHWPALVALGLSLPIALIPLAAIFKVRRLHRLYAEDVAEHARKSKGGGSAPDRDH